MTDQPDLHPLVEELRRMTPTAELLKQEKRRIYEKEREDRELRWAQAPGIRLVPVRRIEVGADADIGVARKRIDTQGRLIVTATPGETRDHYRSPPAERRLGIAEADHSVADIQILDDEGTVDLFRMNDMPVSMASMEPLPGGDFLVTGKSRQAEPGKRDNVWIVSADGSRRQSFYAGHGIAKISATDSGRIWAGYFDEGVFGGSAGSPALGRSGLVCWSQTGERLYEFVAPEGCGPITDCYSMSLSGDDVWTCYDADFPVVRVSSDFKAEGWPRRVRGAKAIAAGDGRAVVAVGGFSDGCVGISIVDTSGADEEPRLMRLMMPDGADLPGAPGIIGRGRHLNVFLADQWFRLDVDDLPVT